MALKTAPHDTICHLVSDDIYNGYRFQADRWSFPLLVYSSMFSSELVQLDLIAVPTYHFQVLGTMPVIDLPPPPCNVVPRSKNAEDLIRAATLSEEWSNIYGMYLMSKQTSPPTHRVSRSILESVSESSAGRSGRSGELGFNIMQKIYSNDTIIFIIRKTLKSLLSGIFPPAKLSMRTENYLHLSVGGNEL